METPTDSDCEELSREELHRDFALSSLGRLLTSKAELEKLLPISGRDAVVRQIADLLSSGASVLLVGEPGSGKTAIVEKLAAWLACGQVNLPESLWKRHILECDHTAFQDQCLYVHEFETRFRAIINKCRANDVILFFENVHLAAGSGAVEGNEERTVATMLAPHLGRGRITVVGTTTPEGYQALLRRNPAFADKFIKWEIAGTSASETREALYGLRSHIQVRHGVEIEDSALDEIIRVADRLYPWKAFPGKAFEILKETVARKRPSANAPEANDGRLSSASLAVADVFETVERRTGLAPDFVHRALPLSREGIVQHFADAVFEQEEAISCLTDAILTFKAELNDPERPVAVFLFCGPSGVGKTELARQLARYLFGTERRLLRYDMSEFADFDGMRRFLGDGRRHNAKDFVGAIIAQPFSVVLLDEIEKANSAIFNLLLQAFGDGRLTDLDGRTAYLANSIIIMTSNLAADLYGQCASKIGLLGTARPHECPKPTQKQLTERVKVFFAPEFVNRITKIVCFNPLSYEALRRVARKEIDKVLRRDGVRLRGLRVSISPALEGMIVEQGFDPEYGARPMQRAVEKLVISPLAATLTRADIADQEAIALDWNGVATEIHRF